MTGYRFGEIMAMRGWVSAGVIETEDLNPVKGRSQPSSFQQEYATFILAMDGETIP